MLFVGGSRNGVGDVVSVQQSLVFVDGELVIPDRDGVIDKPLNATVEQYQYESFDDSEGAAHGAYFFQGMEPDERSHRLVALLARFTPAGEVKNEQP